MSEQPSRRRSYRYGDLYSNLRLRRPTVIRASVLSETGIDGLVRSIRTTLRRWQVEGVNPVPAGCRAVIVKNGCRAVTVSVAQARPAKKAKKGA
ncbi:MAG: hypothetical protein AAB134_02280 [Pseudomonadota bacterium]